MTSHRAPRQKMPPHVRKRAHSLVMLAVVFTTIGAALEAVVVAGVHP